MVVRQAVECLRAAQAALGVGQLGNRALHADGHRDLPDGGLQRASLLPEGSGEGGDDRGVASAARTTVG